MIPAYSPQARGRCERSFGTWQNRLPQELRLAGLNTLEQANTFLRQHYIAEFNRRFTQPAAEKGTAFRKCRRKDLNWVFSIQTERAVAHDNTIVATEPVSATGQDALSEHVGGLHGHGLRTPRRPDLGPLGTTLAERSQSRKRRWKRRRARRLGNLADTARFPLSTPSDDDSYTEIQGQIPSGLTGQIPCQ